MQRRLVSQFDIFNCWQMVEEYERKWFGQSQTRSGGDGEQDHDHEDNYLYDVVIRIRPDAFFSRALPPLGRLFGGEPMPTPE